MSSDYGSYYVPGAAGRAAMPTSPPPPPTAAMTSAPQPVPVGAQATSKVQTATLVISIAALVFSIVAAVAASYCAYVIYNVIEGLREAFGAQ
jgi:hypothetical protein